jgi:putative FmdB family regulatory protein
VSVPTYEYRCDECERIFEVRQRISDPPLTLCDTCGGPVRRLLSPAPFILKGAGWYVTDYPSESRKKAMEAEKSSGGKDGTGTDKPATTAAGSTASSSTPSSPSPGASSPAKPSD